VLQIAKRQKNMQLFFLSFQSEESVLIPAIPTLTYKPGYELVICAFTDHHCAGNLMRATVVTIKTQRFFHCPATLHILAGSTVSLPQQRLDKIKFSSTLSMILREEIFIAYASSLCTDVKQT
jgi:hypothetical protein